ncbi:MAG: acyl-CoA dehydrogenase family protein, partial [Actinomycetota bacterium]
SLVELATDTGRTDPVTVQRLMALRAKRQVNEWNGQRAKAALENGTSSPVASLGKLAMSDILHTAGSLQTEILGAEGTIGGMDSPRSADATYSLLNAFFTSIGGGTDQIQRNIIGERLLGLPKEPSVDRDLAFRDVPKAATTRTDDTAR